MITTISTGKSGGLKYLEDGEDKNRLLTNGKVITREMLDERVTLQGDLRATENILESIKENDNYTQDYYHLTHSFKEDIPIEDMQSIAEENEAFYLVGYNKEEYNIYTEYHIPKENARYKLLTGENKGKKYYDLLSQNEAEEFKINNPEHINLLERRYPHIHTIIARKNLLTNTQLKLTEKEEIKAFNAHQEYINIKYGLESPKDNKRDISNGQYKTEKFNTNIELEKKDFKNLTNAETKKLLASDITNQIINEKIDSYEDMRAYLKEKDYITSIEEVKTKKNEYIKIKVQGQEKNINLRADIFSKNYYENLEINFNENSRIIDGKNINDYKKEVVEYKQRRVEEVSKRYDYSREKSLKHDLIQKALNEKFDNKVLENTNDKKIILDLEQGNTIFLTGGAGVGKSYVTKQIIKHYESKGGKVAKLGSTGIAATNINGETLHAYFELGIKKNIKELDTFDKLNPQRIIELNQKLKSTDLIVIDEISMVSNRQMEMIKYRLDQANFQGKMMVVGDFNQLPPISKDEKVGYAFESEAWKDLNTKTHELTVIKRSDNKEFIESLNRLRYGQVTDKDNEMLKSMQNNIIDEKSSTYIYSTNKAVNEHNKNELSKIKEVEEKYNTDINTEQKLTSEQVNKLLDETPLYTSLEIKKNTPVLITSNDKSLRVANGDKGIYEGMNNKNEMIIKLDRTNEIITVPRKEFKAEIESKEHQKIKASFTNYPVRPAYAITTHKSQGMSIDNLAIDPNKQFEKNQFYVALSRAKNPENTKILPLDEKYNNDFKKIIKQDNKVLDFYHPTLRSKELKEFDKQVSKRQNLKREEFFKKFDKSKNLKKVDIKKKGANSVINIKNMDRKSLYQKSKEERLLKKESKNRVKQLRAEHQKRKELKKQDLISKLEQRQVKINGIQERQKQIKTDDTISQAIKQDKNIEVLKKAQERLKEGEKQNEEGFEKLRLRDEKHKNWEKDKSKNKNSSDEKNKDKSNTIVDEFGKVSKYQEQKEKNKHEGLIK